MRARERTHTVQTDRDEGQCYHVNQLAVHSQTGQKTCFVAGKDVTRPFYRRLWLGAERSATTGEWVWGDGSSADAILEDKWFIDEPTAKAYLAISIVDGFSMLADAGSDQRHFVCEIDVV